MAQFFTDFTGESVGASPPTGWTPRWSATTSWDVATGPVVTWTGGSTVFDILSWDAVGSVSGDVEIAAMMQSTAENITQCGVGIQGSTSDTSGYHASLFNVSATFSLELTRLDAGAETNLALPAFTWAINTDFWIRLQKTGNTVRARAWQDGSSEPGTWLASVTDSTFSSGVVGIFARNLNGVKTFKKVGVGTDGDAAPLSGGGGGGPTLDPITSCYPIGSI